MNAAAATTIENRRENYLDAALSPEQSSALRSYADRVVNMHEERDTLNGDIREVYREAKDAGFDTTTLREIVRELRMEPDARSSRYALLDTYRAALGLLVGTPLGDAAMERVEREPPPPVAARPRPFAEQPIKRGRGRPRKDPAATETSEFPPSPSARRPRKPRPMDFLPDVETAGRA
jgi:uncharacterized protein (UPF0335 family)